MRPRLHRRGDGIPVVGFDAAPGVPLLDLHRLTRGLADAPFLARTDPHAHEFVILIYVERGSGEIALDRKHWTVTAGQLVLIAPGQIVAPAEPGSLDRLSAWCLLFSPEALRGSVPRAFSSWRSHPLLLPFVAGPVGGAQRLTVPETDRAEWNRRLERISAELREPRTGSPEAMAAWLTLLLVDVGRLTRTAGEELRSADEPMLAAVFDLIEERYAEPLTLSRVAAEVGLTPGYLTTSVRRRTGRTVQQWITQRRLQVARQLLADTDDTVATIGRRVGWPDSSYFGKQFRAEHELSPLEWRRRTRRMEPG